MIAGGLLNCTLLSRIAPELEQISSIIDVLLLAAIGGRRRPLIGPRFCQWLPIDSEIEAEIDGLGARVRRPDIEHRPITFNRFLRARGGDFYNAP